MISSLVSRASALVLLVGGVALLFAPDAILPMLVPGFPPAGAWLGQLLGAAWLGLAALDWTQRSLVLGGIYGRPVVFANLVTYFVSGMAMLRAATGADASRGMLVVAVPMLGLAMIYGALLFRGPFDPLRTE